MSDLQTVVLYRHKYEEMWVKSLQRNKEFTEKQHVPTAIFCHT